MKLMNFKKSAQLPRLGLLQIERQLLGQFKKMTHFSRVMIALLISLVIALGSAWFTKTIIVSRAEMQFEKDSSQIKTTLDAYTNRYRDLLYGLHSFVLSTDHVTEKQFHGYTESFNLKEQYPAIHMLDYSEEVDNQPQNVDQFYRFLSDEYEKNETDPALIKEINASLSQNRQDISRTNKHFIIKYSTPIDNTYMYLGTDLSRDNVIYQALLRGEKYGQITSSGKVFYDRKNNSYPFVVLRMTTYNEVKNLKKEEKNIQGSVGVSVRLDKSLFGHLNDSFRYIDFQVIDSQTGREKLLYDSRYTRQNASDAWPEWLFSEKDIKFSQDSFFQVGRRVFMIRTFSKVMPPNVADMVLVLIVALGIFALSFVMINYGLFLKIGREEAEKRADDKARSLEIEANTDALTRLPNRRAFFTDLDEKIRTYPYEKMFLFFIDLDGFKRVNDTCGHQAGDQVLKEYSERLASMNNAEHPFRYYRVGGDEFTVLIENREYGADFSVEAVENLAKSILTLTHQSFKIKGEEFMLSQSIGIAEYDINGKTPEELFKNADMAMYQTKNSGKGAYLFFSQAISIEIEKKSHIINLLLTALEKNEFHLVYQPKMQKINNRYVMRGVESLLRWNNPKIGNVSPGVFIPLAEEAGLMPEIGTWLVKQVARKIHDWEKMKTPNVRVAINISAKQFIHEDLADKYASILAQYGVEPDRIVLEITESAMMKEPEKTKEILTKFRRYGFGISVDDFGTGHSSLSYLRQFPVTEIKIDKAFTDDILLNNHDRIIVEGIISMSRNLDLDVVIEGVETREQVEWIESQNVKGVKIQGYYFSKPLEEKDLIQFYYDHK